MGIRYRADHAGSLLRPQELRDARTSPNLTGEQLTKVADTDVVDTALNVWKDA